jgi:hypothetical protein
MSVVSEERCDSGSGCGGFPSKDVEAVSELFNFGSDYLTNQPRIKFSVVLVSH